MAVRVILAPSAALARQVLEQEDVVVSVEAEYGSFVAEGRLYTAAHHQPSGPYVGRHVDSEGRPSPCNDREIPHVAEGVILVSHVDLDTFGGCIRAFYGPGELFGGERASFWDLAEQIDVRGAHHLFDLGASPLDIARLYAWRAWNKAHPVRPPRDAVLDITDAVSSAEVALAAILDERHPRHENLIEAGRVFRLNESQLNRDTYAGIDRYVLVRVAYRDGDFCNHLYRVPAPDGVTVPVMPAVVVFNKVRGNITISLADPVPGVSCREIVQALWGPEAGGHDGIAGSPREAVMSEGQVARVVAALNAALSLSGGVQ